MTTKKGKVSEACAFGWGIEPPEPAPFLTLPEANVLLVLLGPTGVGKTALSLRLARHFDSPIISCDSRQVYKGLEIGTAAPLPEQLEQAKHYFIGNLEWTDYYNASRFEEEAVALLRELHLKRRVVVMTGGSMLYIDAVCKGIDEIPTVDGNIRDELWALYEKEGLEAIRAQLKIVDPEFYRQVDLKNHKRVIHALEVCLTTGRPYSSLRTNQQKQRDFTVVKIGLVREREELYDRINRRVEKMMEDGLLEEARRAYPYRRLNALNTVGYKELFSYFDGEWTLDVAVEKIKQNTRIYARKQMTWFKRDREIRWFHPEDFSIEELTGRT